MAQMANSQLSQTSQVELEQTLSTWSQKLPTQLNAPNRFVPKLVRVSPNASDGQRLARCVSGLKVSDQVRAGTKPARGRGTASSVCTRVTDASQTLSLARCVLSQERWILANQITATGWSHRLGIFTQLTCILFYCQIIMTI